MDLRTNTKIDKEYVDHAVKMQSKWCLLPRQPYSDEIQFGVPRGNENG